MLMDIRKAKERKGKEMKGKAEGERRRVRVCGEDK